MKKAVFITGASRGIGFELALVFARRGYRVVAHGRNRKRLKRLQNQIVALGGDSSIVVGDVTDAETIQKISAAARKHNISVCINNAGVSGEGRIEQISGQSIHRVFQTNLIAPIQIIKKIYPLFLKKKRGIIVNINSVSGLEAQSARPVYCASKWGLRGFAEALRKEALKHHIRIVDIYPSRVKTRPKFTYGMDPHELAEKIYHFVEETDRVVFIVDDRPKAYKRYA